MRIRRIKTCLNGQRTRPEHPAVPVSPAEVATAAAASVAAGAEAVHLHARGADGAESVWAKDVGAAVAAVRQACPGTPVGVSTGIWITGGDPDLRLAGVSGWAELPPGRRPDFASVNIAEPGLTDLLTALDAAGVAAEAGLWTAADADVLAAAGAGRPWLRILVEVLSGPAADAAAAADEIIGRLERAGLTAPVVVHGLDATCWPLIRYAGRRGLATRIGLEDTLLRPDGSPARDNAELTAIGLAMWTQAGTGTR